MAGILANSASYTMVAGDTAVDKSVSGLLIGEQITLSTSPTSTSYTWGQSIPSGSSTARSGLSSTTDASPVFTPDAAGTFVITCVVAGGTSYVIRVAVVAVATSENVQTLRFLPVARASVPTPSQGTTLFFDKTSSKFLRKATDGLFYEVDDTVYP